MCWTRDDQQTVLRCADGKHLYALECDRTLWTFPDLSASESAEYGKLSLCSGMRLGVLDLPENVGRSKPGRSASLWRVSVMVRLDLLSFTCLIRQDSDGHSAPPRKMADTLRTPVECIMD